MQSNRLAATRPQHRRAPRRATGPMYGHRVRHVGGGGGLLSLEKLDAVAAIWGAQRCEGRELQPPHSFPWLPREQVPDQG